MKNRLYKEVMVTNKAEKSILLGHPWVYGEEIVKKSNKDTGEIVDVVSSKGKYLGTGFYNDNSKITVRLLSRNANDLFDYDFFKRRVKYAFNYLNLDGLDLNVYSFNPRGIHCYEKVGFVKDGQGETEEDIHMSIRK